MLEIKEIQSQAKKFVTAQLKTDWTTGTMANFQKMVKKLKNRLGNKVIQIKNFCLTKDCIV